jgi:branched-chain amino acid transport system ATP-binding protein
VSAGLSVRGLTAGYGPIRVLHGVDLDVPAGRLTAVVGPNGAGKTTLLRALSGLVSRGGDARFGDGPLPTTPAAIVARGLGHVPEGRELFARMTVRENLELGAWRAAAGDRGSRLDRVIALFPRLGERHRQLAGSLSGGEQQMLAIGRALMGNPRLLMLDEPSLGLAPRLIDLLLDVVRRLPADGITVLLVEQNVAKALTLAEHAYVLERGRVTLHGPARALLASDQVRAAYLGEVAADDTGLTGVRPTK